MLLPAGRVDFLRGSGFEFLEIEIFGVDVLPVVFYYQAGGYVGVASRLHPQALADRGLIHFDAAAFLNAGEQASGDSEIVVEMHFDTRHLTVRLVDPKSSAEFLGRALLARVGGCGRVAGEIKGQGGSATK